MELRALIVKIILFFTTTLNINVKYIFSNFYQLTDFVVFRLELIY